MKENGTSSPAPKSTTPVPPSEDFFPLNMSNTPNSLSPASRDESKGHMERKRKYSDDDSLEVGYFAELKQVLLCLQPHFSKSKNVKVSSI